MTKNIMIVGVGGQGTLLTSRIIGKAALSEGCEVKISEVHGMAQRGGSVVSHVRTGEEINSPLIPLGSADVIIGFEPAEAVRCLPYLKKDGAVVVNSKAVKPVTASLSDSGYDGAEMLEYLKNNVENLYVIDGGKACSDLGSAKVLNVVLLAAAAASGQLGINVDELKNAITKRVSEKFHELNIRAVDYGAAVE